MSHTLLAVQTVTDDGLAPAYGAAPAGGNAVPGDGETFIHVKNGGAGSINVTVVTGGTLMGEPVSDKVLAIGAGAERLIGPFPPVLYNQPTGAAQHAGQVTIDYSGVTSVTVAAFKLGA